MPEPEPIISKARKRLRDLHARLGSSAGERENALRKIDEWLRRHGRTWNDMAELLHDPITSAASAYADPRDATADQQAASDSAITPLAMVQGMLEQYVGVQPHEYMAATLWVAHTHVYDKFMVTPRLALVSPVRNCGKTTLLDIISCLAARAEKSDNITAAAVYYAVDEERRTLLVDEFDNLEVAAKGALRAVLNSGHRQGGSITRIFRLRRRKYATFAPIALASIGALPSPLMSRSIVIQMVRHDGAPALRRFDRNDIATINELNFVYAHLVVWARDAKLDLDPPMPPALRGRQADNWRPLIAIADACGPAWGAEARAAALSFARGYYDEDIGVLLLQDIRDIFDARDVDRLFSKIIVEALNGLGDAPWSEWRGLDDKHQPRPLSQAQLAAILKRFDIRPRSIWPLRGAGKSHKGYYRSQFERVWRAYCGETGRAAEPLTINLIRGSKR